MSSFPQLFNEPVPRTQHCTSLEGEEGNPSQDLLDFGVALGIFLPFMKISFWDSGCVVTFSQYLRVKTLKDEHA